MTAQGTEEKSFNWEQVAHTSESRKIKKGLGADSSRKTRMFMVCHSTCHILILNIGMCYLIGTKDQGQRLFTCLNEHKSTPLIDIFSLSLCTYTLFREWQERGGDVPLQKQYLRMLCTSEFNASTFPFLKAGFKAQVHLKENQM